MGGYLLEFRLTGSAREFVRETAVKVSRIFHVQGVTHRRVVPHVTIAGPFETDDERRLIHVFNEVCINYQPMTFQFDGLGSFGNLVGGNRVLKVNIKPSEELVRLRSELVERLSTFCVMGKHDDGQYNPHATLAFKDIDRKFGEIKKFLQTIEIPSIKHFVLRVTLLGRGSMIVREFDLFQRRSLTRHESLNQENRKLTLRLMQARNEGDLIGTTPSRPFEIDSATRAFVISDTHFDHENIIRYCSRPFGSSREMNNTIERNWNARVGQKDIVFFLGDMTFGRGHSSVDYWLRRLSGRVFFIRGNHDLDPITKALEIPSEFYVRYEGRDLMLTHDPLRPSNWSGWMVHGDKHNNSPTDYPFINCGKKTVNACVEMTGYAPLSLDDLLLRISHC